MNLANTLYMRMLNHRLQQQQLDQMAYDKAMEQANTNMDQISAAEDQAWERNKDLAKLQGETAAMNREEVPKYETGNLDFIAEHAHSTRRQEIAEMLAKRELDNLKINRDFQAKMFPHTPEGEKIDNEAEFSYHTEPKLKLEHQLRMKELARRQELKVDEGGNPLPFSTEFGVLNEALDNAKAILSSPTLKNDDLAGMSREMLMIAQQVAMEARISGRGDAWASQQLMSNPRFQQLSRTIPKIGAYGRSLSGPSGLSPANPTMIDPEEAKVKALEEKLLKEQQNY